MPTKTISTPMDITVELGVDVEYTVDAGCQSYFDRTIGNWVPAEAPEVNIRRVTMTTGEKKLVTDITHLLAEYDLERIAESLLEEAA